jgi:hypothetical protein
MSYYTKNKMLAGPYSFLRRLYDPAIPLLGIYPKECDSGYYKGTCTPMFTAVLFTIAKLQKRQDAPLLMNALRKCGIYIQWNFIQPQRMKLCHLQVNG